MDTDEACISCDDSAPSSSSSRYPALSFKVLRHCRLSGRYKLAIFVLSASRTPPDTCDPLESAMAHKELR